jgi:hypothetical protein
MAHRRIDVHRHLVPRLFGSERPLAAQSAASWFASALDACPRNDVARAAIDRANASVLSPHLA